RGSGYTKKGHSLPGDRGFFASPQVRDLLPKYCTLYIMLEFFRREFGGDLGVTSLEEVWSFLKFCSPNTVYGPAYDFREEKERWLDQIRNPGAERDDEHCLCRQFRQDHTIPPRWKDIDMSLLGGWDLRCLVSEVYRGAQPPSGNIYQKLITKYETQQDASTVFVSLNYDFVLEDALEQFLLSKWHYPHVHTRIERSTSGVRVLKPHGSLNWCFRGNVPPVEIGTDYRLDSVPNENFECNRFNQAMIIEPTQVKEVLNVRETQRRETAGLFSNIWRSMFDALVQAKRVFVIGYSFRKK
ncbi:MAG: SIR2 family protein, partial [Candidatus Tectomicrobia bacterium]|nr:SIR2 family protein [Candidatus Tectomicrobia bacterium]